MNLSIVDITPLPSYLAAEVVKRPPNTKEFNYKSIVIEEDGKYYYWSRGISLNISREEYEQVRCNPKLFFKSIADKLHKRINEVIAKIE